MLEGFMKFGWETKAVRMLLGSSFASGSGLVL